MSLFVILFSVIFLGDVSHALNLAPFFTADMNQHTVTENTPVGSVVFQLKGEDPEGSAVFFGLEGTSKLTVNRTTGIVTISEAVDRESKSGISDNEIRLTVTIEDAARPGEGLANVVRVPISVIVLDENDNEPVFQGLPYKASVNEDTPVGTTIFMAIEATDRDLIGEVLDVRCGGGDDARASLDLCDHFEIVPRRQETDHDMYRGSVVLKKPLDYREHQIYQIGISVSDGNHTVTTDVVFTVNDVQNLPPVFMGSMTGIVNEDDPAGTFVMQVKARDGDSGSERRVIYDLVENPNGFFVVDSSSGEIRVERALDRESLSTSGGVLSLKVKASELVNGIPGDDSTTTSLADVTITIRDVNDEAPTFNQQEYNVSIPENVPYGTPLANLNMEVKDTDTAPNAVFNIRLLDETGKFSVEPSRAISHTAVSIKVNSQKLDYENPNERKFLLLVVASEESAAGKGLSSTATVTVQVHDLNDNSPSFDKESFTALVSESAPEGTEVITITAKDQDSGDFGTSGIRYKLSGTGMELFIVDPISGKISVAPCTENCIDFETTKAYFLSYSATDNNGEGKRTVVNLRVTVDDANDNPPSFAKKHYAASINEGQQQFQPRLFLKAADRDESSVLHHELTDGNINGLFALDPASGEVTVTAKEGLRLDNIPTDIIRLTAVVTDGVSKDSAMVEIAVKDINDRHPVFEKPVYLSSVPETAAVGTPVENVMATDADFGPNAEVTYRILKGAYNDFAIDPLTGLITTFGELDYERRDSYSIEVVAVDKGVPSLSGTTTLTVSVMKKNHKAPFFSPSTQRTQITEDSPVGGLVIRLNATDPDVTDDGVLQYSITEPITAVDRDGKQVDPTHPSLHGFFSINATTGEIFVASKLDRNVATIVTLPVQVTDPSAVPPQHAQGSVIVTLVDVNDFAPQFQEPWSQESPYITITVPEEQQNGSVVYRFIASDPDSNIDYFKIEPSNRYFDVEPGSGNLLVKNRIDFESLAEKRITFDLFVFDTGVPQKNASALVVANIENLNDNEPIFSATHYEASIFENAEISSPFLRVNASDLDEGEFGLIRYRLAGSFQEAFSIDAVEGTVSVRDPSVLDRERVESIVLQAIAFDSAPDASGWPRSSTVPINITIVDVNDNPPQFLQKEYAATIVDNIPYYPEPSPIAQVSAVDPDIGVNGQLYYRIIAGNEAGQFLIDNDMGIIYPNSSFLGQSGQRFELIVEVADEGGNATWPNPDQAKITVDIENVNSHKPEWFPEPPPDQTIEIAEESEETDVVILKVNARDRDVGDNQRISYFLKDRNENVHETETFSMNEVTGELKAKGRFDREIQERYELVLVARDHGTPVAFETLRFVTVLVKDVNDNGPRFPDSLSGDNMIRFTVPEEEEPGYFVGRIEASDPDEGENGRVYYYIIVGNNERWFSIDKSYGNIYTKRRIDRESVDQFNLTIKASNEADILCDGETCDLKMTSEDVALQSVVTVQIFIEDKNDNLPQFKSKEFFIGIPYNAKVGDLILNAEAQDPDLNGNGKLTYSIKSSNLFRAGSSISSGSLVPSPFTMQENGRLMLGSLMAEFNQDKFEIEIEAKESESNHRAKAKVNIWVYEQAQLIKLIISRTPREVNEDKNNIIRELSNVTQNIIAVDDIRFHISKSDGLRRDMTDMYVHAVDDAHNLILMPEEVLKEVDKNYDHLALYYKEAGIHSIVPAVKAEASVSDPLDTNLIALIFLLILIFFGVIMFTILCCCMKNWVAKPTKAKPQQKQREVSPIYNTASIMDEAVSPISPTPAGGTDNPLWIDQKYKAYEEQELTMTVFSDQDNSVISGGNNGQDQSMSSSRPESLGRQSAQLHLDTQSNAYATINKLPMIPASRRSLFSGSAFGQQQDPLHGGPYERDYATLEKPARSPPGPLVPGIHSTPIHQAALSRRFSNDFSPDYRSNFAINKNGEPELLADLI